MPRPDLQVANIEAPSSVNAGGSFSVTYTVINQGSAATTVNWDDKIYLSLTPYVADDSILIQDLPNQTALEPGDEYQATTIPVTVPDRYAGQVYVIVDIDANHVVDQWPNGTHDIEYQPVQINPIPFPDLVLGNVVAPTQVIAGSTFNVSYTVTNLGSGPTLVNEWTDSVWLARDKTRPIPASGDILLTQAVHNGGLALDQGYDQTLSVTLPIDLAPGIYYITPWTDLYSVVLQNELSTNVNPDDPNNFENDNYKALQIDVLAPLPDLVVSSLTAPASASGGDDIKVNWTVTNEGNGPAQPIGWIDTVYLTNDPTNPLDPNAITMTLGSVTQNSVLNVGASYNASLDVELSPSAVGQYIVVYTDAPQPNITTPYNVVAEVSETNNLLATTCVVTPVPADLVITNVSIPTTNYSGESMTFSYTVENEGANPVWEGTDYWTDFIWVSPEATFNRYDASFLGQTTHEQTAPLEPGQSYTVNFTVTLPAGTGGQYYLYIDLDAHNDLPPGLYTYEARLETTDWWPADTGDNSYWLGEFTEWAFENPFNNRVATPFDIIYREPDLTVTNITVPSNVTSGSTVPITYTVTNRGTRATRTDSWTDRIFLSQDPSLDTYDTVLGQASYGQVLAPGATYTETVDVRIPDGIEGNFDILVYADSDAATNFELQSDIGYGLYGVMIGAANELNPYDLASASIRSLGRGQVPQYEDEADKISSVPLPITLAPAPHLQVTAIGSDANAGHVYQGQTLDVTYTVTNTGAATPPTEPTWNDLIYFSADTNLDLKADVYLGMVTHQNGLGAGASYTVMTQVQVPMNLSGPYYLFVITNPPVDSPIGTVFEGGGSNQVNSLYLAPPLVIDPPPPSQLVVSSITLPSPSTVKSGNRFSVGWTVTDEDMNNPAVGSWSDAVYIGTGTSWSIADTYLGSVVEMGPLAPGGSYSNILDAVMPSLAPGEYHIFVRADIYDQLSLPPGVPESSKTSASAGLLTVAVDSLTLGVPYATTLSSGQERLLQVTVPQGATLQVSISSDASDATNEIYLKQGAAPTQSDYDAAYQGGLSPNQTAVIPSTVPGVYYVLIEGNSEPADDTPVSVLAKLLPLSITNVQVDQGGDSEYVTTEISGAQFQPNAIVKLVMPGFAEYQPLITNFVNSTEILAEFDLTGATFGLYDVQVINPDGQEAIAPYRFEIEQTVQPDVTIGVGGPRFILAGDTGTYSVSLQNLGNINAPYVEFNVGIPQLSNALPSDLSNPNIADPVNINLDDLPYVELNTNLGGEPLEGSTLDSRGAVRHAPVSGRHRLEQRPYRDVGQPFQRGRRRLCAVHVCRHDLSRNGGGQRQKLRGAQGRDLCGVSGPTPARGILNNGPEGLNQISPELYEAFEEFGSVPSLIQIPFAPFQFDINASATTLTRSEFVAQLTAEADALRTAILADSTVPTALENLAADQTTFEDLFLASLEQSGELLPQGTTPPISQNPLIMSLMSTLATGVLAGPAGSGIISGGNVSQFFNELLAWYGNNTNQIAPAAGFNEHGNEIATLPTQSQYNANATLPTNFEDFNVYEPWVAYNERANLPPSFQIDGVQDINGQTPVIPLDLSQYVNNQAQDAGLASMTGPFTSEDNGYIPNGQPLPFTVNFQNDPEASTSPGEIRITTQLDPGLDPRTFRLGDIQIGDIDIQIPSNLALFQGDFDFTSSNGFIVRVSAGVDLQSGTATWLIEAINPVTGLVITNPDSGLLPPNNAEGAGAGYVTYTIEPYATAATGTQISATATVLFNTAAPQMTAPLTYTLDSTAPTTQLTVSQIGTSPNYQVTWNSTDDAGGSGVAYVDLYVSEDNGAYQLWQSQVTMASGTMIYQGQAGHTYSFLALATDVAGNHELPPSGANVPQNTTTTVNPGALPTVPNTTPPNFGIPPAPTVQPSTNPLFAPASSAGGTGPRRRRATRPNS